MDYLPKEYTNLTLVYNAPTCDVCGYPCVDIHQDEGCYCLDCWSDITEPR